MKTLISALGIGTVIKRALGIRLGRLYQYPPQPLSVKQLDYVDNDQNLPTISLVTPSFNQAKFIGKTINSIKEQHYPKLQYIIQDACSKDGTEDIIKSFSDDGFDICIEPDQGQADALNKGFSRTSADIMCYLNSDDLLLPGTLHFIARYFSDTPSVDVIYGNRLIIDASGNEIGRWILSGHDSQVLRSVDYIPQETMFWRRRVWERVGAKFDENLQFAMDWELILRFLDAGAVFHHVPELFGIFRAHGAQKSQANFSARGAKEMTALRLRYGSKNLNSLQRILLHGRYLYQHVKADSAFGATL